MVHIAAITPHEGQGEINVGATLELIDYLCRALKGHTGGIVLFDAVGEYPALRPEERSRLLYLAVKRSRVPLFAGVGSATLDLSIALAHEAHDAGVSAVLLPPPYFCRLPEDEIREFYLQFGVQADGAVYLEHLPEMVEGIPVETARELLATRRFCGIVDSTGEHAAGGLQAVIANDRLFRKRCTGAPAISAVGCAVPELVLALDCALAAGKADEIARLTARLEDFLGWMDELPATAVLRVATRVRGIKAGPVSMPLPPTKQKRLEEFREWFEGWKI